MTIYTVIYHTIGALILILIKIFLLRICFRGWKYGLFEDIDCRR